MIAPFTPPSTARQTFDYELVTPEQARAWLDNSDKRQRRPGSSKGNGKVRQYADAMLGGKWDPEVPQGVFLTPDGQLINGGNRLTAIVLADQPVTLLVVRNVPERIFDVIDTGKARFPGQFLAGPAHASVARWLMWYGQRFDHKPSGPAMAFDLREVIAYGEDHEDEIGRAVNEATAVSRGSHIPVAIHAAVLVLLRQNLVDEARLKEWLESTQTGASLPEDDPRLTLRARYAHRAKVGRNAGQVAGDWTAIVWALNAYMAAEPLSWESLRSRSARGLAWPRIGESYEAFAKRAHTIFDARHQADIRGNAAKRGIRNAKRRAYNASRRTAKSTLVADAAVVQELAMAAGGTLS